MSDFITDLNKWVDIWDSNREEFNKKCPSEPPKADPVDLSNIMPMNTMRGYAGLPPQLINEAHGEKETIGPHLPNPVHYASTGEDQKLRVTPNWNDGEELIELHHLKIAMEQLESKLNAADAFGDKTGSIQTKLDALREKFHDLSHEIQPDQTIDKS